ncbi:MAG: hypothetical protein ABIH79_01085 [archaeon]
MESSKLSKMSSLKKTLKKHSKKIITITSVVSILLILYLLHSTGIENIITKSLNPIFNMIDFAFSQTFFTLPLKWMPLALVIFLIGFVAIVLILWPYIFIGVSFVALIAKTLWNKRKKKKRIAIAVWIFLFGYVFTVWFAMANDTANWLPGKSQTEYILYEKANPWAEKYTPEAVKKAIGENLADNLNTILNIAEKQNNFWKWINVIRSGAKIFLTKGIF